MGRSRKRGNTWREQRGAEIKAFPVSPTAPAVFIGFIGEAPIWGKGVPFEDVEVLTLIPINNQ